LEKLYGPCAGDSGLLSSPLSLFELINSTPSGGGFYSITDGRYWLQGIISAAYSASNGLCDNSNYAVFTNVSFFVDWIRETVETNATYINMDCTFGDS